MSKRIIDYTGKDVYIGMDVHKKTYSITAICAGEIVKRTRMSADPRGLVRGLKSWFKGARIHSVYEAGFSGFVLHRILMNEGVDNIVVNPASVEVAANDKVKNDRRDSQKLSEQLSFGKLKGIYVPTESEELKRCITRTREQIVNQRARIAKQIKSKLHYFGLLDKDDDRLISNKYLRELESKELAAELKFSLKLLADQWRFLTKQLADLRKTLQEQAKQDNKLEQIYRSVPGIGQVTSRILSNELGDLAKRFTNERSVFNYTGLTPSEYSSGEKVHKGNISRQGSARIRGMLVEISWRAIQKDEALREIFERISKTRGKKRAIVAVARKLIGRIRACFRTGTLYSVGTYA